MILHGSKRSYEVTGETNSLTKDIERYLKRRKVAMMYRFKGVKILSDAVTSEINNVAYKEMIIKRDNEYACISYIHASNEPPDILVAYLKPEKYIKHV